MKDDINVMIDKLEDLIMAASNIRHTDMTLKQMDYHLLEMEKVARCLDADFRGHLTFALWLESFIEHTPKEITQ